jgi:hypothetical protein
MRKLQPPQSKGSKTPKNITKADSQHPKKSSYVVMGGQKSFVEIQVVFPYDFKLFKMNKKLKNYEI